MTTVQSGSRKPGQRSKISVWRRPAIPRAQTTCSTEDKNNDEFHIGNDGQGRTQYSRYSFQ